MNGFRDKLNCDQVSLNRGYEVWMWRNATTVIQCPYTRRQYCLRQAWIHYYNYTLHGETPIYAFSQHLLRESIYSCFSTLCVVATTAGCKRLPSMLSFDYNHLGKNSLFYIYIFQFRVSQMLSSHFAPVQQLFIVHFKKYCYNLQHT